jgi:hypothetical protein
LQTFLTGGFIDFATYLEMSSHPKAQALLKLLQRQMPSMGAMPLGAMQSALSQGAPAAPPQLAPAR